MCNFDFDITTSISPTLRQQSIDAVLNTLIKSRNTHLDEQTLAQFRTLSTDHAFLLAFEQALQQGGQRFFELYLDEDEDLVEAIVDHGGFFAHKSVQAAFLGILREPSCYVADGQEVTIHVFDEVLPRRRNRRRVNRAMSVFLSCLAQEVWHLPELRMAYDPIALTGIPARFRATRLSTPSPSTLLAFGRPNTSSSKMVRRGELTSSTDTNDQDRLYHNLPTPDYERFVGRKRELAQLQELLLPTARHFAITIDGIGGIGKSALALEVAHRYRRDGGNLPPTERFDAIIWVTAKQSLLTGQGIITRPQSLRTLDDIYSTIASTLQREDITRARSEEQDEIVRRALIEQRTLLIIDNLETVDDERVMHFIRHLPAPTKAIVTTRHRLNVAYPIRLVGMSHNEALELISDESKRKHVTLTNEQATRLYKRTGGVPLAIVWSIAQMGFGHGIEPTLTRLAQPNSDIAQFCFQNAIHLIRHTPAHHLLLALSLFATDANRNALGYITNLPILDRDEGLEELERLSLVNKENGRFVLLPLTKAYSEEELGKETGLEEAFRERLVGYYFNLIVQSNKNKYDILNDHQLEYDNILAVTDWCWDTDKLGMFIDLVKAMTDYLWLIGAWQIRTIYLTLGLKAAISLGSQETEATFLGLLAHGKEIQGQLDEAESLTRKALQLLDEKKHSHKFIFSIYRLGAIALKRRAYIDAKKYFQSALEIAQKVNNLSHIGRMQRRLAIIDMLEENYGSAQTRLTIALKLNEDRGSPLADLSHTNHLLGELSFLKKEYNKAMQYWQKSLEIAKNIRHEAQIAGTKFSMARLELTLGNINQATQLANEALSIFTKLGAKQEVEETQALLDEMARQRNQM